MRVTCFEFMFVFVWCYWFGVLVVRRFWLECGWRLVRCYEVTLLILFSFLCELV